MSEIDKNIAKLKQNKIDISEEIKKIKEENRDVFPARGRKKKA